MQTIRLDYYEIEYSYYVRPTKEDYIEFLWEQKTGAKFDKYLYKHDDPDGIIYKQLEDDWAHNKIDELGLSSSDEFKSFLTKKYEDEAYSEWSDEQASIARATAKYYSDLWGD